MSHKHQERSVLHNGENDRRGLTLIEVLVGSALFAIISSALYLSFADILEISTRTKLIQSAAGAIQAQVEVIRNMQYQDIGIAGGWPAGSIPATQNVLYNGTPFVLSTTVRNIDDPFDGTLGGVPNDTAAADYKLVEVTASCPLCNRFIPITLTARVAPRGLETSSNNGALFVNVFDAQGGAIAGADVTVVNMSTTPTISITDTTNANGLLQLIDIPTSTDSYQITVGKGGYSSERTYTSGAGSNPNPIRPHATVAQTQVTQVSFPIDRLSAVTIESMDDLCNAVPQIDMSITGTKLIGTSPDVLKYATGTATGVSGILVQDLEWDTYTFGFTETAHDLIGYSVPGLTIAVNPSSTYGMRWTVAPEGRPALLVSVFDEGGDQLNNATVTVTTAGFSETKRAGVRQATHSDWPSYTSQSGGVNTAISGQLSLLVNASGTYTTGVDEWLVSNTIDLGTSTTEYHELSWMPTSTPPAAGPDSVRFQVAGNNDGATWNFAGPTGPTSYYTTSGELIAGLTGMRYVRYKVFLKTADEYVTPTIEDVGVHFGSGCLSAHQAYFGGLPTGAGTVTAERVGYQPTSTSVVVGSGWQEAGIWLNP